MIDDPLELMIEEALRSRGIRFTREDRSAGHPSRDNDVTLDFHLPEQKLYIEVKRFHTSRVADQMAQASDVIVVQGRHAVAALARLIRGESL